MRIRALLLIAVIGPCNLAAGAEEVDCSTLENAEQRLACFDARYPKKTSAPPVGESVIGASQTDSKPERSTEVAPAQVRESAPAPRAESKGAGKSGLFGDPKVDLTTVIRAVRAGEKQKMVFLLENGEIWMQSSPRPLPFREGDTVTIKNAMLGGYFMRSTAGVSTRVQKIQ